MTIPMEKYLLNAKHFALLLAYGMGFFRIVKAINNIGHKRLTIVTYHRVTDRKIEEINGSLRNLFVNVETFEKQILFFKDKYRITSPDELYELIDSGEFPPNLLLITFDDGYLDFYQHAYPVLKKHGIPVTMFVVPGKMGGTGGFSYWWDELYYYMTCMKNREINESQCAMPLDIRNLLNEFTHDVKLMVDRVSDTYSDSEIEGILAIIRKWLGDDAHIHAGWNSMLTWQNIEEISDLVSIGSHTMCHKNMKYLSGCELYEEIHQSKMEIEEKIKKSISAFSYPNGFYNPEIVKHVQDAGYRFAVTTDKGINDLRNLYKMKRINIWERTSSVHTKPFSEGKLAYEMIGL
jgi:peptidoglycan/xylan/chitin deacetylase (PgdA/CDA1 family)